MSVEMLFLPCVVEQSFSYSQLKYIFITKFLDLWGL